MTLRAAMTLSIGLLAVGLAAAPVRPVPGPGDRFARPFARPSGSAEQPIGYSPHDIRQAYGLDAGSALGGGRLVAVVVAFHEPSVETDLARFVATFGLPGIAGLDPQGRCSVWKGPHPCFQRAHPASLPGGNPGWALETAQDVQWVHAIAPLADLLLVEAASDRLADLLAAVDLAVASGADIVEMSWGGQETSEQLRDDVHFSGSGTAFVAAVGDSPGAVSYPATSPYVVAVGATTLQLDGGGRRLAENAWAKSGGGLSRFEPQPDYQARASAAYSRRFRTVPDVAADGDFETGYAVTTRDFRDGGPRWYRAGGSSSAAAIWAALLALVPDGCAGRVDAPPYGARLYQDAAAAWARGYDLRTGLGVPDSTLLAGPLCRLGRDAHA